MLSCREMVWCHVRVMEDDAAMVEQLCHGIMSEEEGSGSGTGFSEGYWLADDSGLGMDGAAVVAIGRMDDMILLAMLNR